jgi:hypothetical protein
VVENENQVASEGPPVVVIVVDDVGIVEVVLEVVER